MSQHSISYPAGCIMVDCNEAEKEKIKTAAFLNSFEEKERKYGRLERAKCINDIKKGLGIKGTYYELYR